MDSTAADNESALETRMFGTPEVPAIDTPTLIAVMLDSGKGISDLIFSPGRPPQVERHGELTPVLVPGLGTLSADDTVRITHDLIGSNQQALAVLQSEGACDLSYSLPERARF